MLLHLVIDSISPAGCGPNGGCDLTITGDYFDDAMEPQVREHIGRFYDIHVYTSTGTTRCWNSVIWRGHVTMVVLTCVG